MREAEHHDHVLVARVGDRVPVPAGMYSASPAANGELLVVEPQLPEPDDDVCDLLGLVANRRQRRAPGVNTE